MFGGRLGRRRQHLDDARDGVPKGAEHRWYGLGRDLGPRLRRGGGGREAHLEVGAACEGRIVIELMTSDRQLKASSEGSK